MNKAIKFILIGVFMSLALIFYLLFNFEGQDISAAKVSEKSVKPKLIAEEAKKVIGEKVKEVTTAISTMDMVTFSGYIHPKKGVRFSQYGIVNVEADMVFTAAQIRSFLVDKKVYTWGSYDGSGDPIELTPKEYFNRFIFIKDFLKAQKVGYNEVLSHSGYPENQFVVYPNAIIVEFYFPGIKYEQDWKALRIVFEEFEKKWYVVGIINNQWTI